MVLTFIVERLLWRTYRLTNYLHKVNKFYLIQGY